MGQTLEALLELQSIERQIAQVRRRLRARKNAVTTQQRRIDQLGSDLVALETQTMTRRKEADQLELELKVKEEEVAKFRAALNTARTNKEYAAILTHINTRKADNAKFEERALNILQDVDAVKAQAEQVREQIGGEQKQLAEIERISAQEIERLTGMMEELSGKRSEAVKAVPPKALAVFERLAISYDGEAMALALEIKVNGLEDLVRPFRANGMFAKRGRPNAATEEKSEEIFGLRSLDDRE